MSQRLILSCLVIALSCTYLKAGAPSVFHAFAQVGDGSGIQTIFLISNDGGTEASVTLKLRKADGSDFTLTIGAETASSFTIAVPAAGGMVKLTTAGTSDPLETGWAELTASVPVGAQVLFEIRSGGTLVTQAAVESSGAVLRSRLFVDHSPASGTGVAVANLSGVGAIRVRMTLKDESGNTVATVDRILGPYVREAEFLPTLFSGVSEARGTLLLEASGRFAVVALQQTGLVLGTLPPVIN